MRGEHKRTEDYADIGERSSASKYQLILTHAKGVNSPAREKSSYNKKIRSTEIF
jgi:hypothetical protein